MPSDAERLRSQAARIRAMKTACFTGYRPSKLPWGANEADERCHELKAKLREAIALAYEDGFREFISGMAQGVDTYAAEETLKFADTHRDVALVCALPWKSFGAELEGALAARRELILSHAANIVICAFVPGAKALMARNMFMVDSSSLVIAVYDGESGGTRNTLRYAEAKGIETRIIAPERESLIQKRKF